MASQNQAVFDKVYLLEVQEEMNKVSQSDLIVLQFPV